MSLDWHVATSMAPGPQPLEIGAADPDFRPRPIGFTARLDEPEPVHERPASPLLWEGDQA